MHITIFQMQPVRLDLRYRMAASHGAACGCETFKEQSRRPWRQFRHQPGRACKYVDLGPFASSVEPLSGQSERKFTACCATTDHGKSFRVAHCCQRRETVAEIADRLNRNGMYCGARDGTHIRLAADIDR